MDEQIKTIKKRKDLKSLIQDNYWIFVSFILFGIIIIMWLGYIPIREKPINICEAIEVTPAWIQNETLLGYGVVNVTNIFSVDNLIKDNIYFYYSSRCSACLTQIQMFGKDWTKYKESGLTIDCENEKS